MKARQKLDWDDEYGDDQPMRPTDEGKWPILTISTIGSKYYVTLSGDEALYPDARLYEWPEEEKPPRLGDVAFTHDGIIEGVQRRPQALKPL